MRVLRSLAAIALFTAVYAAATVAGRMTVMDDTNLSMIWPAAGAGVVWFCARRDARNRWIDLLALIMVTVVVNLATGASPAMAAVFVAANVGQLIVFLCLFGRWRPHLWGAGGHEPMTRPSDLWGLLAAAVVSTACGAGLGSVGIWVLTDGYSSSTTAVWLARNTASILLVGVAGLRLGCALARWRRRPAVGSAAAWLAAARHRLLSAGVAEYVALIASSALAYAAGFSYNTGLPLAFALIAVTVWASLRLTTGFVIAHDLCVGTAAVLFTLGGTGPFAAIESHAIRALIAQLFVAIVAVVGLVLALGRDERDTLMAELAAGKEEASQQAALMSTIIDSMADGVAVIDAHGQVVLRNPAAGALLGGVTSPADTVTGSRHYGLFRPDGTPLNDADLPYARAMAGDDVHGVDLLVRNAGVPDGRIVSVTATALPDAEQTRRAVVLFHDVTAERRHRDELAGFAGVVAHDLLNPLTTVDGWTEAAVDALGEAPAHAAVVEAGDCLTRVRRAAARMRGLINDLLAYTTARDAAVAPGLIDLSVVVAEIAIARTDAATAVGNPAPRFAIGHLDAVHADPVLIRQLLDNLIGNSIKYTAPGVTPAISIRGGRTPDGSVRVEVSDNGIGIPAGQHEAIFENFHRAHRTAQYTGTGLGLAICKRIVERHGGTITAGDNPGGGARFVLTLPAAGPRALVEAASAGD
ncbi:ATP-binding protein [Cryptosporangium sp. NPDC048952]|uniref:ATP-binding protein n=1 Tax=Cryptosporangium sp. NPDC048952 TaxID=3363961 RepID=UPI003713B910